MVLRFITAKLHATAAHHRKQPKNQDQPPVHVNLLPECREDSLAHGSECIVLVTEFQHTLDYEPLHQPLLPSHDPFKQQRNDEQGEYRIGVPDVVVVFPADFSGQFFVDNFLEDVRQLAEGVVAAAA